MDPPIPHPSGVSQPLAPITSNSGSSLSDGPQSHEQQEISETSPDTFGLFRWYHAATLPSHDPESVEQQSGHLRPTSNDVKADIPLPTLLQPYPNKNAFLLAEWYWNGGSNKSKESFKKLLDIVCDELFDPRDIRNVSWDSLNERLAECPDSEGMWLDQPDAGWKETSITLSIPFPKRAQHPGVQSYTFPPFRHRSIVSVLKEKMTNTKDFPRFHFEPYELRWRRRDMLPEESTRVYGEFYTSPAYLDAHKEIQSLASEPGCSLPKVMVGLLFGSDSTLLTSFGNSSLWPCYMYFGNESKYRRCKPEHNLCNHIAYFQKV